MSITKTELYFEIDEDDAENAKIDAKVRPLDHRVFPSWNREINSLMVTHLQTEHITGFRIQRKVTRS